MQRPNRKKLTNILQSLSVQDKITHPTQLFQSNLDLKIKNTLSNEGLFLLTSEVNNIINKEKLSMKSKNKAMDLQDFRQMKYNLKAYGKNKKLFRIDKIIKENSQPAPPLKNIVKIHENKFVIAKEYNMKLSQKIDAIMQSQNVLRIKQSKKQHLQTKIYPPLIKQLKKCQSTHNFAATERLESLLIRYKKGQSAWTQRREVSEEGNREKQGDQKFQKYRSEYNYEKRKSVQDGDQIQKQNSRGRFQFKRYTTGNTPARRLKKKALLFS